MNKTKIEDYLIADGVSTVISGFGYLVTAISNYEVGASMISFIYPVVAKLHHTTPARAERSIRHAIESSEKHKNNKIVNSEYISMAKLMIDRSELMQGAIKMTTGYEPYIRAGTSKRDAKRIKLNMDLPILTKENAIIGDLYKCCDGYMLLINVHDASQEEMDLLELQPCKMFTAYTHAGYKIKGELKNANNKNICNLVQVE